MIIIYFQKHHSLTATRTFERVIAEGMQYAIPPAVEGQNDFMLFSGNGGIKIFVLFLCSCIETIVADLF